MDMGHLLTLYSLYCDWTTIIIDHHVLGVPLLISRTASRRLHCLGLAIAMPGECKRVPGN